MENTNNKNSLIEALYICLFRSLDKAESDFEDGTLSIASGRDGKVYFWYLDENHDMAISFDGKVVDDEDEIERLFC